jgi:hypothetical protein
VNSCSRGLDPHQHVNVFHVVAATSQNCHKSQPVDFSTLVWLKLICWEEADTFWMATVPVGSTKLSMGWVIAAASNLGNCSRLFDRTFNGLPLVMRIVYKKSPRDNLCNITSETLPENRQPRPPAGKISNGLLELC